MSISIPDNAPFDGPQKMWLKGFLAGLSSAIAAPPQTVASATLQKCPVTILWGSQTGTAETLAKKLAKSLASKGHAARAINMAESNVASLADVGHLLLLTSTYGDGEPPDNAAALLAELHQPENPSLMSLKYAVFALGDSSYPEFCKCGHDFDQRLAALGAERLSSIVECDGDPDDSFATWISQVTPALA